MNDLFLKELKEAAGDAGIIENEPMMRHTTFRVGGPADYFTAPDLNRLPELLRVCKKHGAACFIIGNGSNLLVGDKGIRGLVIQISDKTGEVSINDGRLKAGAGMLLSKAANMAANAGLSGMEFAAGIPGTVGGAVVMNAGAYDGEIKDILSNVTVLDEDGKKRELSVEELELGYRRSCIAGRHYIVTEAEFLLKQGNCDEIFAKMEKFRGLRTGKQPLEYPSAGSTFKRPEGYFAGKLIMDAGLSGFRVGGAQVSEKHCGFIINKDGASAKDIATLMQEVSERVERRFGVTLEPEVRMIGEF